MANRIVKQQLFSYESIRDKVENIIKKTGIAILRARWEIGQTIYEVKQKGQTRANYGEHLIEKLAEDFTKKYGNGFSASNLRKMRQFYSQNKIWEPVTKLNWKNQLALMKIENVDLRREIALEAEKGEQTVAQIKNRTEVEKFSAKQTPNLLIPKKTNKNLMVKRPSAVHSYAVIADDLIKPKEDSVVLDLGFHIWRMTSKSELKGVLTDKAGYTYPGTIVRIIDGDTLLVRIDCGFNTMITEKLRLRGIDCPEINTVEGKKAKQFVEDALKDCPVIMIRTHTSDKYDRYVSDVYYLGKEADPGKILEQGKFLNQELLNLSLARIWK